MTFEIAALALVAIALTSIALYGAATGRLGDTTRQGDPPIYWLGILLLVGVAALHWWMLTRPPSDDGTLQPGVAMLLAPLSFYLIAKWLRSGEIVFGANRFPRRGRAQPYWTILSVTLVGFVFFTATIVFHAARGAS